MGNILLQTDSYKHSHFKQYPPGTKFVSSYIEARADADHLSPFMLMGVQAFIYEYLRNPVTLANIAEAKMILGAHGLPFNEEGWKHIVEKHDGFLPISIQALPEGSLVPSRVPVVQVRNTDPLTPWLTSFVETALLRSIWYMSSVATTSAVIKIIARDAMKMTSDDPEAGLPFKLHDFGARGASSGETAALGGLAHLVNFKGSDTLEAITAIRNIYYDEDDYMPAFSIPASEHSTMTAWGPKDEQKAYANMMDSFGETMFSIVSDSYDLQNAVENIFGDKLKAKIETLNGKLIVRPDSGDPLAATMFVLESLWESFGGTVNSKGYRVLHPKVGVIQGDGLDPTKIVDIMATMQANKFSVDNIAFGMGGGLLQKPMRDDWGFAMKTNAIDVGDGWQDVQKKPATDPAKASKAGRQAVIRDETTGILIAVREDAVINPDRNLLTEVWNQGPLIRPTFEEVRAKADADCIEIGKEIEAIRIKELAA